MSKAIIINVGVNTTINPSYNQLYINVNKRATFGLDPKPGNNSVGDLWRKKYGRDCFGQGSEFYA